MKLCKVNGNSMHPFIQDEDLFIVKKVPFKKLKRGNILVFRGENDLFVVHRLIKKKKTGLLVLRGDAYNLTKETITYDAIVGMAVGLMRNGKMIRYSRQLELYFWINARVREFAKNLLRGKHSV